MDGLRLFGPLALAVVTAVALDQLSRARGLDPPGFVEPWRRAVALAALVLVLFLSVFAGLGQVGLDLEVDFEAVSLPDLFFVHALLVTGLAVWLALGFTGTPDRGLGSVAAEQVGFHGRPGRELLIGLGLGLLTWPILLLGVGSAIVVMFALGQQEMLPSEPPDLIVWVAGLPLLAKLAIAASAGFVEEAFFRGFLQPRMGVALSSLLFILAHLSYDQPFMLIGITLLSVYFAAIVTWRQSVWAAAAAHFLFDAIQLTVVIPWALGQWEESGLPMESLAEAARSAGLLLH